jgi:hypothetical protein
MNYEFEENYIIILVSGVFVAELLRANQLFYSKHISNFGLTVSFIWPNYQKFVAACWSEA